MFSSYDLFDDEDLDPEVADYISFMESDEQDSTGFLTKKEVEKNRDK